MADDTFLNSQVLVHACRTLKPRELLFSGTIYEHTGPTPKRSSLSELPFGFRVGVFSSIFVLGSVAHQPVHLLGMLSSQLSFVTRGINDFYTVWFSCSETMSLMVWQPKYRWSQEGWLRHGPAGKVWAWTLVVNNWYLHTSALFELSALLGPTLTRIKLS